MELQLHTRLFENNRFRKFVAREEAVRVPFRQLEGPKTFLCIKGYAFRVFVACTTEDAAAGGDCLPRHVLLSEG